MSVDRLAYDPGPRLSISGMTRIVVYARRWHRFSRWEAQDVEAYAELLELTPRARGWVRSSLTHKRETLIRGGMGRSFWRKCARGMAR